VTTWQQRYVRRFYDPASGWRNGTEEFHASCRAAIVAGPILEIGAGPTNATSDYLATIGELHGLDLDADVRGNRALKRAMVFDGDRFPVENETYSACVSNYVLEHVGDPHGHLGEVFRVLKPGGAYIFRTPNRYHYVSLISLLTPDWFHQAAVNRLRNLGPEAHDPYPTRYLLNTRADVVKQAHLAGFTVESLQLVEKEPSYGMSSRLLFMAFMAYERLVNASERLSDLRANLFVVLRKP